MLDVRITGYVVPLSEQPQASLTPVISVVNVADEDATITGLIRIYRDSTGLMIYDSRLAVTELEHGTSANIAALTPFDPPAPADDDYFIKADLVAASHLPGPPLPVTLGAWHFDVKTPPMGEAPAGHHGTHEEDGSDELETGNLGTTEMDDSLVLHPDGAGGVEWVAGAGVDHGALTGLADDDHPQYRLRHEVFSESDCFCDQEDITSWYPWSIGRRNNGTLGQIAGTPNHPGIGQLKSSTSANSGIYVNLAFYTLSAACLLLAGSEVSIIWHRPQTLAGTTRHAGFHDTATVTDPAHGAWIWQDPATGIIYGRTKNNAGNSTTGTGFQLVTNTWYCEKIVVNSDASQVDFYCYAEDGTELWHDSLAANIPTAVGDEFGHGITTTNSGTTAVALDDVDYLSLLIPNRRPNL